MKILFSPIGGTDPMKYYRDGSMLHICRHYKPDKVILYLSKEMMELHEKDNRYVACVEKLGELLEHHFEVEVIDRRNLVDVQQYDTFYVDFRDIIRDIEEGMNSEDELIINMASGTPAMKSALLIMATLAEYRFKAIQVSTPEKSINHKHDDRSEFDVDLFWEMNEDNSIDAPNRCEEVRCLNLVKLLKTDMIKKHVDAYDYPAALSVAKEIEDDISPDAMTLLKVASARVKLNRSEMDRLLANKSFELFPVKESGKQKLFEYALVLQTKIKKEEYADFIRGITPLVVDLLEDILKSKCNITVGDYTYLDNNGMRKWNITKLQQDGLKAVLDAEYLPNGFKGGPIYSDHLCKLICNMSGDASVNNKIMEIKDVESKVRNIAAHEIVSVTDQWFVAKTGKNAETIMALIREIVVMAGIRVSAKDWKAYDDMNDLIKNCL